MTTYLHLGFWVIGWLQNVSKNTNFQIFYEFENLEDFICKNVEASNELAHARDAEILIRKFLSRDFTWEFKSKTNTTNADDKWSTVTNNQISTVT